MSGCGMEVPSFGEVPSAEGLRIGCLCDRVSDPQTKERVTLCPPKNPSHVTFLKMILC